MKTSYKKPQDIKKNWHLINAKGRVLGRLSCEIARLLQGKHKMDWAPHLLAGDFVVVIGAEGLRLSGKKWDDKIYHSHSRHIGSLKTKKAREMTKPLLIQKAVMGMLSKNKLRKKLMRQLKIYEGAEHPHGAQNPVPFDF